MRCLVTLPLLPFFLFGCSIITPESSDPASYTAMAIFQNVPDELPDKNDMRKMVSYKAINDAKEKCLAKNLARSGWTTKEHSAFMKMTGGTGDFKKLDRGSYSKIAIINIINHISKNMGSCN